MAERVAVSLDHRFVWPDGHEAWLEMRAYPVDDGLALFWRDVTARRQAEARLRESEARFRLMADAVPQIVWITDADGQVEFFNKQWADYTGERQMPHSAAAVAASHVHPEDTAATLSAFDTARRNGSTLLAEHRIRSASGDYRWFLVRAEPFRDPESGRILRWFGTSVDIHDRKTAESALRESEARLSRALEAGGLGAWELDLSTLAAWRSPQHDRIFGYPAGLAEWTYDRFLEHVVPEDRARVDAEFKAALAGADRWEFESRICRADGQERWIWAQGGVERKPDGQPARIKGMVRDITPRRVAEEKLRALNDTLEAQVAARSAERDRLWNLSQDLLARADYSGMMSAVSPAWTRILGWSESELLTRGYATFMHPDDMGPTLAAVARMAETRQPSRFENRIATLDGGWKHIEWTVAPEPDGLNFIAVGRDVSLAKQREAELDAAREALRQSQKMEAMGSLTGGVAHDFNNLLAPIMGSLDLLVRRNVGGERERRLIDGALRSAERARILVQRLLAFARRQPLQPTAVDVGRLVQDMKSLIGSTVGPMITVHLDLAADLPAASADHNQLEMALLNLAVNARDAMPEGGELTIGARRESVQAPHPSGVAPGLYVRLGVSDTGIGMDKATRDRAIEPFFSTKGIGKGTGLGLSMVHGLVAQLGGGLRIESSPGQGTTVELWLPVSAASGELEAEHTAPLGEAPASRGLALLVDDEELVRMSTADMLGELGFRVVEAASAEEALRLMKTGTLPDLLLTDHLMPGMSGVELAHHARRLKATLPVLIVSGYAEVDAIAPDLPRLAKPFRNAELAASLGALMADPRR